MSEAIERWEEFTGKKAVKIDTLVLAKKQEGD